MFIPESRVLDWKTKKHCFFCCHKIPVSFWHCYCRVPGINFDSNFMPTSFPLAACSMQNQWNCQIFGIFFSNNLNQLLSLLVSLRMNEFDKVLTLHCHKLWSEMNQTTLGVGHFKTVSGHVFANYINTFYKTEDLTVIWRRSTYLNLN